MSLNILRRVDYATDLSGIVNAELVNTIAFNVVNAVDYPGFDNVGAELQLRSVMEALTNFNQFTVAGSENAITLTNLSGFTTYPVGYELNFIALNDNTGPVTVQINGGNVIPLVNELGNPLKAGDIKAGSEVKAFFDGTSFKLTWSSYKLTDLENVVADLTVKSGTYTGDAVVNVSTSVELTDFLNSLNDKTIYQDITVNIADGSYDLTALPTLKNIDMGDYKLSIIGNVTNPGSVIFDTTNTILLNILNCNGIIIDGFTIKTLNSVLDASFYINKSKYIEIRNGTLDTVYVGFSITDSSGITIDTCSIDKVLVNGIYGVSSSLSVLSSTLTYTGTTTTIDYESSNGITIHNKSIIDIKDTTITGFYRGVSAGTSSEIQLGKIIGDNTIVDAIFGISCLDSGLYILDNSVVTLSTTNTYTSITYGVLISGGWIRYSYATSVFNISGFYHGVTGIYSSKGLLPICNIDGATYGIYTTHNTMITGTFTITNCVQNAFYTSVNSNIRAITSSIHFSVSNGRLVSIYHGSMLHADSFTIGSGSLTSSPDVAMHHLSILIATNGGSFTSPITTNTLTIYGVVYV